MAHPSTPAGAIAARLFRAAVLSVASLLLSTCARDVTAPPAPTQLAFLQQPENLLAGHQFSQAVKVRRWGGILDFGFAILDWRHWRLISAPLPLALRLSSLSAARPP